MITMIKAMKLWKKSNKTTGKKASNQLQKNKKCFKISFRKLGSLTDIGKNFSLKKSAYMISFY